LSAWPKRSPDLTERSKHVWRVVQDAVRRDSVKHTVAERESFGVSDDDARRDAGGVEVRSREFDVPRGQIHSSYMCASPSVKREIDTLAAADVQDIQAGSRVVVEGLSKPRRIREPRSDQLVQMLSRALSGLDGRPAGIGRPLLDGSPFVVDHGASLSRRSVPFGPRRAA